METSCQQQYLLKQVFKVFNSMTVAIDDSQDLCKV